MQAFCTYISISNTSAETVTNVGVKVGRRCTHRSKDLARACETHLEQSSAHNTPFAKHYIRFRALSGHRLPLAWPGLLDLQLLARRLPEGRCRIKTAVYSLTVLATRQSCKPKGRRPFCTMGPALLWQLSLQEAAMISLCPMTSRRLGPIHLCAQPRTQRPMGSASTCRSTSNLAPTIPCPCARR